MRVPPRSIRHHVDMSLAETALLTAAGDRVYGRGEDYVRYVRGLRIAAEKAYASVQAKQVYPTAALGPALGHLPGLSALSPPITHGRIRQIQITAGYRSWGGVFVSP